jgi:hypothetical protein
MATRGKKKREGGSGAQLRRAMEERGAGERWLGLEARLRGPRASGAHQRCAAGDVGWGGPIQEEGGAPGPCLVIGCWVGPMNNHIFIYSKLFFKGLELIWSKEVLPDLKKIQIKYILEHF